jgi:hypothetical protein
MDILTLHSQLEMNKVEPILHPLEQASEHAEAIPIDSSLKSLSVQHTGKIFT